MTQRKSIHVLGAVLIGVLLIGVGIVIAGVSPGVTTAQLDDSDRDSPRLITVSASGTVDGEPDEAVIRLSVEATADDPATARSQVATDASQMRQALLDLGLSEDQIRTAGFNIYEHRPRSDSRDQAEEVQYRARHAYVVELSEIDRAGEVIDAAVDNGATSVQSVQFVLADDTQRTLREQALQDAMSNARSEADVIASSGDVTITGLHSASTTNVGFPVVRGAPEAFADGDTAQTTLDPGPVTVSASVTVQYEIA